MLPSASERVRTHLGRSEQVSEPTKTSKHLQKLRGNFANVACVPLLFVSSSPSPGYYEVQLVSGDLLLTATLKHPCIVVPQRLKMAGTCKNVFASFCKTFASFCKILATFGARNGPKNIQTATRRIDDDETNFETMFFWSLVAQKTFWNESFSRCDRFRQIFVQIKAILVIFRPFEIIRAVWIFIPDQGSRCNQPLHFYKMAICCSLVSI